jgi:proline racemase
MLNFEPRGSGLMCSVLLLPPSEEDADFSVIIMEQDEYVPMCGHCIIGTATTVVAEGMVERVEPVTIVKFDTPAGRVRCEVEVHDGKVGTVTFDNVESFLLAEHCRVEVEEFGSLTIDVAYGGDMYAIVDADELNLELSVHNDSQLINAWQCIRHAVGEQLKTVHPEDPRINQCYQVLFTSKRHQRTDYRQTILVPPGTLDRSPCGTGTSARLAMLFERGEVKLHETREFEGPLGTFFSASIISSEVRNGIRYSVPRVTGRAYITGYHRFVLDPEDPLPNGYRVGPAPR